MDLKNYYQVLFPYAYNILGSSEDAKDAIQDVITKYLALNNKEIENLKGYLIKGVVNQSISLKNKKKKINYGYHWLPEPVATERADKRLLLNDIFSYSMLVLLEQLNVKERAVFILREAFGYTHQEIAEVCSSTTAHSRKLLSRAKSKLHLLKQQSGLPHSQVVPAGYLENYLDAIKHKDITALEKLLVSDITVASDGGGKVSAIRKLITGREMAIKLLIGVFHKFQKSLTTVFLEINHQPAIIFYQDHRPVACQVFGISTQHLKIHQVRFILDPDKLKDL